MAHCLKNLAYFTTEDSWCIIREVQDNQSLRTDLGKLRLGKDSKCLECFSSYPRFINWSEELWDDELPASPSTARL